MGVSTTATVPEREWGRGGGDKKLPCDMINEKPDLHTS